MGLFKKKVIKEIVGGAWGHLVYVHKIDVDTLYKEMRCVECHGVLNEGKPVKFLQIFKPAEAQRKGVVLTGWETFDEHPDLILFGGYLTGVNEAHLEWRK